MEDRKGIQAGEMVQFAELATRALNPRQTDHLFTRNEGLFVEVAVRWIQFDDDSEKKIAAFGRILPFAPYLSEHVERFLSTNSRSPILSTEANERIDLNLDREQDLELLLGLFRFLSYDCQNFARYVRPLPLQSLFQHVNKVVRYLAVRAFCLYVHAADNATQDMVKRYVGEGEVIGKWEGQGIDYRFLSLWEERRWKSLRSKLEEKEPQDLRILLKNLNAQLSPYTVNVTGILLPRLAGASSQSKPAELIPTPTTDANLRKIATCLLGSSPLLLTGLAGSGKTLLVRHFAWQLNKLDSMVTLHLNEQSDAKLLVGMYATGAKPGTFSWRAGVLTTAVKEGRWIFIEDLDRAPNEVISTLLPLIERGELLIPSRGETIRAARGFRIIATMRSTLNPRGHEIVPRQNMIGYRFWNSLTVKMPQLEELETVISTKYPALKGHVPGLIRVYARLLGLFADARFSSENGTSLRALTPRDLLKWCDRIAVLLSQSTSFSSANADDIFMEAFECFAGSLRSEQARSKVMACAAEELHIDPQRRDHLLSNRVVKLEVPSKTTASGTIRIGRARLSKHVSSRKQTSGRPFSTNDYTLRLLEKVAVAVDRREPLLLVGETGTGKTTSIQYLADQLGRKLVAFNLSQQSESGDLLGGYKPVNVRSLVIPLKDEFDDLFDTTFSRKKNARFLEMMGKRVAKGEWKRVCMLWREALKMVDAARKAHESQTSSPDMDGGQPKKKRRMDSLPATFPKARWEKFASELHDLEAQLASGSEAFAFSFLEGNIVKAVRNGDWVLLDEINLASSDTLEAIADLLGGGPDGTPSILLTETGNVERVIAHPNFRVFAAMNPATDVGKKDLPPGIRSRFTELYVESPDSDVKSLRNIVEKYLGGDSIDPVIVKVALDVTNLYLDIQKLAKSNMLVDGADQKAHFSLRTLTRTLSYAKEIAPLCTLRRALYEGFHMSFLTFLDKPSEDRIAPLIKQHLFSQRASAKAELGRPLQQPLDGRSYVRQGHYWLRQGVHPVEEQPHYIITPFVQRNMNNLIRAASTRKYPVLIQGPTSSGKTSMIEYLAKRSGNKFVRINNHEHTDLQEYLGSYVSGPDGKLAFQEGILVRALREGHWIVLDELNLAPTDVLEALNRLLDDNRELLIPETQEVVRPHKDFMLFATQNPAGLYGGRKVLSRAFRNRFLELHFDDIPVEELTEILHRRTMIPESWCKKIVVVYKELSTLRQENRIFEQKSFATLRDLFRWAQRKADTVQDLGDNGFMLLAERVRKEEERQAVKKVIETVMSRNGPRIQVNEKKMYCADGSPEMKLYNEQRGGDGGVVWTRAMRRLYVLVAHALRNNEPVLLVGETGCGKTTVCQMLADAFQKQLHILNAHQNTETGDLIGAQRPIRNRAAIEDLLRQQLLSILDALPGYAVSADLDLVQLLDIYDKLDRGTRDAIPTEHQNEIQVNRIKAAALFEWANGTLVHAMNTGQYFLLDEISLADDSVLERLNSVLESSRTMLLAEKGPIDSLVTAAEGFQFLATMNPGGDYGKRELSPALRNRFTEIWVPALSDVEDIMQIVQSKLSPSISQYAGSIVSFAQWFNEKYNTSVASSISIRDTLAWVTFINQTVIDDPIFAIVHGAAMVFIDTLGANPAGLLAISSTSIDEERRACLHRLSKLLGSDVSSMYFGNIEIFANSQSFRLGSFSIPIFSESAEDPTFSLEAPTTRSNAMRVVRALQLAKPILLEGNPGVGKTTLITAITRAVGKPLTRLNLSEQTDLMDLFGSDVPIEGGQAGNFEWRDAPFLKAMKNGDWVLLDEMNLASQSVLEGLNAVLDHRGEVYISELDQTFHKHSDFRVFAAQNPHHQGGGRKGLPASFVNRFTVVYADVFRPDDLSLICAKVFPHIEQTEVKKLINFVATLDEEVVLRRSFGALGSPWEFNLRDTLRWLQLLGEEGSARDFLDTIFVQRFRTEADRARLLKLFKDVYGALEPRMSLYHNMTPETFQVGLGLLARDAAITKPDSVPQLLVPQLAPIEALMVSVKQSWPVILVGPSGSGKTTIINQLSSFVGADLATFAMNADIDAMDLVGGYEQVDPSRDVQRFRDSLESYVRRRLIALEQPSYILVKLLELLESDADILSEQTQTVLISLAQEEQDPTTTTELLDRLNALIRTPQQIEGARFQWVDGILIRALEQGQWLVLDNANLCSSAVLDRLNSLLEPNGYLSINEHSTADGQARIVKPHKNFRIFLTVDPRFGELSRAMRNRAVEICLLPREEEPTATQNATNYPEYPMDSSVYRFRHFMADEKALPETLERHFEHLSFADTVLLSDFNSESSNALTPLQLQNGTLGPYDGSESEINSSIANNAHFLSRVWSSKLHRFKVESLPYHPLINELNVYGSPESKQLSQRLASLYDVLLDIYKMKNAIQKLPSARFERRKEKQKLPKFLQVYGEALAQLVHELFESFPALGAGEELMNPSISIRILFWNFLELARGQEFDRATFQTLLKMLHGEIQSLSESRYESGISFHTSLSKALTMFSSDVQLKTGLGMERIWKHFRPNVPTNIEQLTAIITLENIADRLDAAMWKSNLKIDEMVQIRERFANSLQLVMTQNVDAQELILALEGAVHDLEERIDEEDNAVTPYFEDEFEGLCQFLDLLPPGPDDDYLLRARSALLARRPTKGIGITSPDTSDSLFKTLYQFAGIEKESGKEMVLRGRFHVSLLDKIQNADEVQLTYLDQFQSELQILSKNISLSANCVTQHQNDVLPIAYRYLVNELCISHQDAVSFVSRAAGSSALTIQPGAHISEQYRQALEGPSKYCLAHLATVHGDAVISFQDWIDFALVGLVLYVPNYPHDPALRPMIERKIFNELRGQLLQKLKSLQHFQTRFTGQDTSLRISLLSKTIEELGAEPPVPTIVRPEVSELDALQGDFTNLLSTIQPLLNGTMGAQEASYDSTLRSNISLIISRLVEGYRSYSDITAPAVGFLVCLHIGLSLGSQATTEDTDVRRSLDYVSLHTPLFGMSKQCIQLKSRILIQNCEQELNQGHHALDLRWHALHSLATIRNIEPTQMSTEQVRGLVHNIFVSFYSEWKQRLLQDQEKEAENKSLYTYKGDAENEEEEDFELFPDYENEEQKQPQAVSTSREHAIRLANIHAELFIGGGDASDALKRLLEWCSVEMVRVSDGKAHGTEHENALPVIFLALERKSDSLSSSGTGRHYNFYFDANLPEAKRFVILIHRIQHRYRQIRKVWPEHATLSDVLRTCDEAVSFRHVDPVAKFITKAEKLHGYMYEWQRVASKEFSTTPLYDDLTKLLVSWRQLELTTWARLFDIEMEKCRDEAKSWFFLAYEMINAAPESIQDDAAIKTYAKDLLRTLEGFFSTTTIGQFEQRIRLLEQLCAHIALRTQDVPSYRHIRLGLTNFITYFSRLTRPVQEALAKGRQTLEKQVNEVIKLASWKDTNIEALKQSAKTSHRKLSKLVRKFRALLNQPIGGLLRTGFPERTFALSVVRMADVGTTIDDVVLERCELHVPGWSERPTRFKNFEATIKIMRNKSTPSRSTVDGAEYIENFITELEGSIVELQKATPNTLTDENKETVKQLKTQKRKLYADTMKELRQMGVKSNLSSDILARQDEISTVLARMPSVSEGQDNENAKGSGYFLHKSLSIMEQFRALTKDHSGDLTPNDVARSLGYLEGLLHVSIRQRGLLSRAEEDVQGLQGLALQAVNLCLHKEDKLTAISGEQVEATDSLQAGICWLSTILKTGGDVVAAQAKLGKTESFAVVVRGLREWSAQFRTLADAYDGLPTMPQNTWAEAHVEHDRAVREKLFEFGNIFKTWIDEYPMPRTVLKQIEPHVLDPSSVTSRTPPESNIATVTSHYKDIFETLDLILGSMQDVGTALNNIPTSTEDATWLIREEEALSAALSAMHTSQIKNAFKHILDSIHQLKTSDSLQTIAAMFAVVQPILRQYLSSHYFLIQKLSALHLSTTKLLYRLSKSFIQVGTQGFCTPPEKSTDQQPGKDEKLESGTGLGEGEGAEDISKDIEDDEDLEDLAQEKGGEREGSIEEEEDAVEMGEQDMEGEMGDVEEKGDEDGEGEEGNEDAESEVGSVDDLGPSAVDEKMWDDGGAEDDNKEKEGKQDIGTENVEEQVASEQKDRKGDESEKGIEDEKEEGKEEEEDMDMEGEDQDENVGVGETEQMDPHAKEEETLDLPDELDIEGNDEDEKEEDGLDDMDMGDEGEEEENAEGGTAPDTIDDEIRQEDEADEEKDATSHIKDEEMGEDEEQEGQDPVDDDLIPLPDDQAPPDESHEQKDTSPVDPNTEAGAGAEANEEAHQNKDNQASASAANREDGTEGETTEKTQETNADDGQLGQTAQPDAGGHGDDNTEESPESQSFKKLGDVLEKWYNQQRQIQEAQQKDETQVQELDKEVDMADAEFEHLENEEDTGDTQALGTATEEQAKALDTDMAMAVDEDTSEKIDARPEDKDEQQADERQQDVEMEDAGQQPEQEQTKDTTDGRPQTFVGEQKPFSDEQDEDMADSIPAEDDISDTSSVDAIETQLDITHLDTSTIPTPETARALWLHHEASTHALSQQLTEHLRLILAPTLATKLRGDFRTGKRLNLKRIIPYIASGYKRDKIWLRRSMPSKRNYQVMIALDDSKSMAESGASSLALKTLTLVTRSLSMLEVGEVSVLGFGEDTNVAHDFDKPFTSEAGVRVFEQFGFGASKTNVKGLIDKSLSLFEEARRKGSSSAGEDLWQLMLVVSDGICDSHAEIQRLVRRGQEERVMIVFIIIDSSSSTPATSDSTAFSTQSAEKKQDKTSILDLQSVEISPEGKVVRWKYMERFPFRYYLVVRDVRELPGVLAGALRQWFGEVAGSA
jgi:midasin